MPLPTLGTVQLLLDGKGVLLITMHRPEVRNAFNDDLYNDLLAALKFAASDESVAGVIITGSGPYFSSGADIQGGTPATDLTTAPVWLFMQEVIKFPKVIVAAVNGPAIGIGTTLIPHCDVAYATASAYFWTPFTRIAVVPEFCSSVLFQEIMGPSRASELLLLGRKLTAEEAAQCGLIARLYEPADLLPKAYEALHDMLSYPLALKSTMLFKSMMKAPRRERLLKIGYAEMVELVRRFEEGDTTTAVMELMSKRQPRSKL